MPKTSADYRTARRQLILDAARRCFLRDGFAATSMQDILSEAGLSVGGVYVYFKSKEEIVEAIALDTIAVFTTEFNAILARDDLPTLDEAFGNMLRVIVAYDQEQPIFQIVIQVWAILRSTPHLAAKFIETQRQLAVLFQQFIERYQAKGQLNPDVSAAHMTQVLIALIMGFIAENALIGKVDIAAFQAGVRGFVAANQRSNG